MFYVRFIGTGNGEWIQAASMKDAKQIFAIRHCVAMSSYIVASKKGPKGKCGQ